jgi:1,4-alpha-glucan branching enzyme
MHPSIPAAPAAPGSVVISAAPASSAVPPILRKRVSRDRQRGGSEQLHDVLSCRGLRAIHNDFGASRQLARRLRFGKMGIGGSCPPHMEKSEKIEVAVETKLQRNPWQVAVEGIVRAEDPDPFHTLGPHWIDRDGKRLLAIRAFRPGATGVTILWGHGGTVPAYQIHPGGFFEAIVPHDVTNLHGDELISPSAYRIRFEFPDGNKLETLDPYAFPTVLTEYDLYLFGEGTHYQNYEKLGAHIRELEGVKGVHFAVWAPNAQRVSVVGDFNLWDGRANAMRNRGATGIWEIFMPELREGALYKFEILSRVNHHLGLKSDPYGFAAEVRPKTASVVCNIDRHKWNDTAWLEARASRDWLHAPMSIYEVHGGSWRRKAEGGRWLTYRELADELIPYVKSLGYTHIEFLPLMEHPFDASWGYQTVGYFAVTSRYGSPEDFMHFVDRCHQEGIGVLLDWTPAHFPRDAHGLAFFDGTHLYEHEDPRKGAHPDWGTLVFNYGRNEVQNFLLSNALFWIDKYHIDGLRVDAVASMLYLDYSRPAGQWIPNRFGGRENLEAIAFIKRTNEILHQRHPGALMVAEESTAWPAVSRPTYIGGLGFDLQSSCAVMGPFVGDPMWRLRRITP